MRISWCGRPPSWHDWDVRIPMRRFALAACAAFLAVTAGADTKDAEAPPAPRESVQPREPEKPPVVGKAKGKEKRKAAKEAEPAAPRPEAAPKPCEPVKPCPID